MAALIFRESAVSSHVLAGVSVKIMKARTPWQQ